MPTTAITSTQILDSGLTGRQLVQTNTTSEAHTVLGLDPSNYVLLDSNNTFTGFNTFDNGVTVNGFLSAGHAEFNSVTVNDDFIASSAEFSGTVEFTDLITGVGGEHQGDLTITDSNLIISGSGKLDATDGDFSGTVKIGSFGLNASGSNFYLEYNGADTIRYRVGNEFCLEGSAYYAIGASSNTPDVKLHRDEANVLALRNGSSGQSFRVYNYGDPTTDSEFLSLESESNEYRILSNITGAGVLRDIRLGGYDGVAYRGLRIQPASGGMQFIYNNAVRLSVNSTTTNISTTTTTTQNQRPTLNGTYTNGTDAFRWTDVYSVDGDFSGTVTATTITGTNSLYISNLVDSASISIAGSGAITIKANNAIAQQFTTAGVSYRVDCIPTFDDNNSLGLSTNRWSDVFATNGSFTGNLTSEVGGSYRLYNLGDESAADQEYLESVWTSNRARIRTQATGAGTVQSLDLKSGNSYVQLNDSNDSVKIGTLATTLTVTNNYFNVNRNFYTTSDSNTCGLVTSRWGNVYSVDGDFSGTVTANAFVGDGSGLTNLPSGNPFDQDLNTTDSPSFVDGDFSGDITLAGRIGTTSGANIDGFGTSAGYLRFFNNIITYWNNSSLIVGTNKTFIPSSDGNSSVGIDGKRFGAVYSVDGSFTGNLTSEVGGSIRHYSTGTDGDTDTSFIEMGDDGTRHTIYTTQTGAGSYRNLRIGNTAHYMEVIPTSTKMDWYISGVKRFSVGNSSVQFKDNLFPISGLVPSIGSDSLRWLGVYAQDGDFSGTLIFNDKLQFGTTDTNTFIKNVANDWLYWAVGGLTMFEMSAGSNKSIGFNSNENQDIDFRVGYNGGRGIDMDGATGNVTFGSDIISSVGGSYKLYNLGDEGDADTEYLEMAWSTNLAKIIPVGIGSGIERDLQLGTAGTKVLVRPASSQVWLYSNGNARLLCSSGGVSVGGDFYPFDDNTDSIGLTTKRWSNVYSVDGDFSGTVTTETIDSPANIAFQLNGVSKLMVANNGITYAYQGIQPSSTAAATPLGATARRWSNVFSVDGSFTGNLINEVGGSYKLYNLGQEGDTDTEYLETVVDSGVYCIRTGATGTGTAIKSIYLGTGFGGTNSDRGITVTNSNATFNFGGERFFISGGEVRSNAKIIPNVDASYALGEDLKRWSNVASVDGDFSGTVKAFKYQNDGTNNLVLDSTANTYYSFNGVIKYGFFPTTFQPQVDNAMQLGSTTKRWSIGHFASVNSINGDFSGNVTTDSIVGSAGDEGIKFDANYGYLTSSNQGANVLRWAGSSFEVYGEMKPRYASISNFGSDSKRWLKGYFDDGSFTGNLVSEVGGSMRLYNLGDESATDSEFISMAWASNDFEILADKTGAGTVQDIDIAGNQVALKHNNGTSISTRISCDSNSVKVWRNLYGGTDSLYNCGLDTNRWLGVYSVDGDFSGRVLTTRLENEAGYSYIRVGVGTSAPVRVWRDLEPQLDNSFNLGASSLRWSNVFAVNSSISNLTTGVGGSYKLYQLGAEGDTDTSYLELSNNGTNFQLYTKATGAGTEKNVSIGTADTQVAVNPAGQLLFRSDGAYKMDVLSGGVRLWDDIFPLTTNTSNVGTSSLRFANVYSVDGDFSGTVKADTIDSAGNLFSMNNQGVEFFRNQWGLNNFYHTIQSNNTSGYALRTNKALRLGADSGVGYGYSAGNINKTTLASAFESWFLISAPALSANWYRFEKDTTGFKFSFNGTSGNEDIYSCDDTTKAISILRGGTSSWSNVDVEVGGSIRQYGLGTDGDTDTEFLNIAWDTNTYYIEPKQTGSGANRNLYLRAGNRAAGVNVKTNAVELVASSAALVVTGSAMSVNRQFTPLTNGTINCGTSVSRWSTIYGVDGDFSGTITTGGLTTGIQTVTAASDTLVDTDHTTLCDCTSNAITINLPTAVAGLRYEIKKIDSSSNAVTIAGFGSETIDGAATITLQSQFQSITIVSDGSNWFIV